MEEPSLRVAVIGATGLVGQTLLTILEEQAFPVATLHLLASTRSKGQALVFAGQSHPVEDVADFDFTQVDLCFFSAGGKVSKRWVPVALAAGCHVVDNTSCFRYDDAVPLVIPEINGALLQATPSRLVANPNCSTIQMLLALYPLHQAVGVKRVNVATYQSVSGAGRGAVEALARQTVALLQDQEPLVSIFPKQIAFNALPHIDTFELNGYTREEMKMVWETSKILDDASIKINPTAVRVPVFYAHSEALHIEMHKPLGVQAATKLLAEAPGVRVIANDDYPTAISHACDQDAVFIGRIRKDLSCDYGLNMWVVADNMRKGAALNAVQIAQMWLLRHRMA